MEEKRVLKFGWRARKTDYLSKVYAGLVSPENESQSTVAGS